MGAQILEDRTSPGYDLQDLRLWKAASSFLKTLKEASKT